jgi:capsid protein
MNTVIDTINMPPEITGLKYDATESSPRRGYISVSSKSEDRELTVMGRQMLSSQGRDLLRNLSLAGFAIRKHNQYVAKGTFNCSIPGQPEYNDRIKRYIYIWSRRSNCDISGRHSLRKMLNLIETHRLIDGDAAVLKIRNGKLQLIEGDRIRNPLSELKGDGWEWVQGVKIGNNTQAWKYCIHKRNDGGGFTPEREINADNIILVGYHNRIDQIRGVSLLAPAINQFRDIYEGIDYALAKAKVAQLLGFATITNSGNYGMPSEQDDAIDEHHKQLEKFGKGVMHLDLRDGEDVKLLNDATPSTQFQQFVQTVIQIALSALDLPYIMYDSTKGNYYGIKGAVDDYIEACNEKQEQLIDMLNEITDWRLRLAIADGELPLPPNGMSVEDMLWYCDWTGTRLPYWRMLEDAKDMLLSIQTGILSPQKITNMYGIDFDENLAEIRQAVEIARKLEVTLPYSQTLNIGV